MDQARSGPAKLNRSTGDGGGGSGVAVTHRSYALPSNGSVAAGSDALPMPSSSLSLSLSVGEPANAARRCSDGRRNVSTARGAAHSPAIWLFDDAPTSSQDAAAAAAVATVSAANNIDEEKREGEKQEEENAGHWQRWLRSERRSSSSSSRRECARHLPQLAQPWMMDSVEVNPSSTAEAPSPRVLDNRLHFLMPRFASASSRRSLSVPSLKESAAAAAAAAEAATSIPSHATLFSAPPPEEVTEDQRSASTESCASSPTDTRTKTWVSSSTASRRPRRDRLHASSAPPPHSARFTATGFAHDSQAVPTPPPAATGGDASSSASSLSFSSTQDAVLPPYASSFTVDGVGPLMIVHLDVLPELRHLDGSASTARHVGQLTTASNRQHGHAEGTLADRAGRSVAAENDTLVLRPDAALAALTSGGTPHPLAATSIERDAAGDAAAIHALLAHEAQEAHTREVAALYVKLEVAEQRARIAEQQVSDAAEVRAAALVQAYKAEERKRRAQFQASLDVLRDENRDLTAKLEAAARAPAMGLHPSSSSTATATSLLPCGPAGTTAALRENATLAAVVTSEADVARQVQSVEAYWRDRLRNAERHWEDEMARQARQRREALDQVEELVRTVEQTQEELRYTRRQAARLREENTRLSSSSAASASAARGLSTSGQLLAASSAVSADEVARLRQALKEHEHREAALLAQVESYGEEATQVRLRCEAAMEKAQQDVVAERRRSTELVKLYGSQLEALHQQLRESKKAAAADAPH